MNLLRSGKSYLSHDWITLENLRLNCKLELISFILILIPYGKVAQLSNFSIKIGAYFTDDRCSGIVSLLAIGIGIYITVWSVFATSTAKLNEELLKRKVENQIFAIIIVGILEAATTILCSVFTQSLVKNHPIAYLVLVLSSILSLAKFIVIIMKITRLNVDYMVEEIDTRNKKQAQMELQLDEIYQSIFK